MRFALDMSSTRYIPLGYEKDLYHIELPRAQFFPIFSLLLRIFPYLVKILNSIDYFGKLIIISLENKMATSKEYMDYILEQLSESPDISCRAMMGEYIIYCGGKVIGKPVGEGILTLSCPQYHHGDTHGILPQIL